MNQKYFKTSPPVSALYDAQARLCLPGVAGRGLSPRQPQRASQGLRHYAFRRHEDRRGILSVALRYWLTLVLSITWLTACETAAPLPPKDIGPRTHLIHVASNGWHTVIVVPAPALVATGVLPEAADFSGTAFLEFGWGDRIFYPAKEQTLGIILTAALVPTPAIMHMVALQAPPEDDDSGLEVISVELTESGFQSLAQALAAEFERPSDGRAESVSRGLYPDSYFYHARGEFHLFNTCNTWTARMLHEGGVALSPSGIVTAIGLMSRLQETLAVE